MRMHATAVACLKGGVGKTTSTVNIAYVLSQFYDKKVLLVDGDPQANLSQFMGVAPLRPNGFWGGTAALMAEDGLDIHLVISPTRYRNIDIVACDRQLTEANNYVQSQPMLREFRLKEKIAMVQEEYDFCFFDCSPSMDVCLGNALLASDDVISPITICADDEKGALETISAINQLSVFGGCAFRGVFFNKLGMARNDFKAVTASVYDRMYPIVFDTCIRFGSPLAEVRSREAKCCHESKREALKKTAIDYENLVAEYLGLERPHSDGASRKEYIRQQEERVRQDQERAERRKAERAAKKAIQQGK